MPDLPAFRRALADVRWSIVGYGGGLAALAAMYTLLFPSFSEQFADFDLPEAYSAFIGDIESVSTVRGFIQTEFYSVMLPLLLMVFAVVASTGQIAGDEGAGTIELVLAQPVSRARLLAERVAALSVAVVAICAAAGVGFLVSAPLIDLGDDITVLELALMPLAMVPFGITFVALGALLSAVAPSRGTAAGLLTLFAVASYLFDVLPDLVGSLDALRYVSLFYYADTKRLLLEGPVPWHLAVLVGVAVAALALSLRAFGAREIGAGRWQLEALGARAAPARRAG